MIVYFIFFYYFFLISNFIIMRFIILYIGFVFFFTWIRSLVELDVVSLSTSAVKCSESMPSFLHIHENVLSLLERLESKQFVYCTGVFLFYAL